MLIPMLLLLLLLLQAYYYYKYTETSVTSNATVLKRFFRDNFVTFRSGSKGIAFLESVEFSMCDMCKFSIFVIVTSPLFGTLQGPISAKCLVIDSPN